MSTSTQAFIEEAKKLLASIPEQDVKVTLAQRITEHKATVTPTFIRIFTDHPKLANHLEHIFNKEEQEMKTAIKALLPTTAGENTALIDSIITAKILRKIIMGDVAKLTAKDVQHLLKSDDKKISHFAEAIKKYHNEFSATSAQSTSANFEPLQNKK